MQKEEKRRNAEGREEDRREEQKKWVRCLCWAQCRKNLAAKSFCGTGVVVASVLSLSPVASPGRG